MKLINIILRLTSTAPTTMTTEEAQHCDALEVRLAKEDYLGAIAVLKTAGVSGEGLDELDENHPAHALLTRLFGAIPN
jgi:hypothetical protein